MSRKGYPITELDQEEYKGEWKNNAGDVTSTWDAVIPYTSRRADKVGPNSPGFPAVKLNNPYQAYDENIKRYPANVRGYDSSVDAKGKGSWPFTFINGVSDLPAYFLDLQAEAENDAYNKCVRKLISRVKNQKVNVAQFAAEFKQTCNLVASTAQRLAQAITEIKKGHIGNAGSILGGGRGPGRKKKKGPPKPNLGDKRRRPPPPKNPGTKSIANDWLALQFGWLPLLSDVNGACEELANRLTYQPPVYRASARGKAQRKTDVILDRIAPNYPQVRMVADCNVSCAGVIEYRARAEWADIARTTGLTNPLSVAWELLPYSFVVDWFIPIGGFLNSLDYDQGIEFSKGWITAQAQNTFRASTVSGDVSVGSTLYSWSEGGATSTVKGFRRTPLGSFPNVPPPSFKDPTSLKHVSEAIALMRQAF
jgi:hypothetical protein